jgi:hypothetical protein
MSASKPSAKTSKKLRKHPWIVIGMMVTTLFMIVLFQPALSLIFDDVFAAAAKVIALVSAIAMIAALVALANLRFNLWDRDNKGIQRENQLVLAGMIGVFDLVLFAQIDLPGLPFWSGVLYVLALIGIYAWIRFSGYLRPAVP